MKIATKGTKGDPFFEEDYPPALELVQGSI